MARNATHGPTQIFSLDLSAINLAFRDLSERLDQLEGLRGTAEIFDEVRVNDPTASQNAVSLGNAVLVARYNMLTASTVVSNPGLLYTEIDATIRQRFDLDDVGTRQARVSLYGSGNEAGDNKGVAAHDGNRVLAEVLWDDTTAGLYTGAWTTLRPSLQTTIQLHAKGSSATEDLTLSWVVVEMRSAQS